MDLQWDHDYQSDNGGPIDQQVTQNMGGGLQQVQCQVKNNELKVQSKVVKQRRYQKGLTSLAKIGLLSAKTVYQSQLERPVFKTTTTATYSQRSAKKHNSLTKARQIQQVTLGGAATEPRQPRDILKQRIEMMRRKRAKFTKQLHQDFCESYGKQASSKHVRAKSDTLTQNFKSDRDRQEQQMARILNRFESKSPVKERPQTSSQEKRVPTRTPLFSFGESQKAQPSVAHIKSSLLSARQMSAPRHRPTLKQTSTTTTAYLVQRPQSQATIRYVRPQSCLRADPPLPATIQRHEPILVVYPKFIKRLPSTSSDHSRDRHSKCMHTKNSNQEQARQDFKQIDPTLIEAYHQRHKDCLKPLFFI